MPNGERKTTMKLLKRYADRTVSSKSRGVVSFTCLGRWYGHVSRSSGLAKTILQGTVKGRRRQGRQEELGRQHQGMDRSGVRPVPEGSGEQRKMEETGCEIICGTLTTLAVKG